jgi:hypothetical protein
MDKKEEMGMLHEPLMTEEGYLNPACINELESAIAHMPKTHERLKGDAEWEKKHWIFVHDVTGYLAMWAIRQSPYAYPDRLDEVVKYLDACLTPKANKEKMMEVSLCEINKMLYDILYEQGVEAFDNWNKCKKGNTPDISFTSRYDGEKDPDYEFVDLDALLHNICISLRDDFRREDEFNRKFEAEYGKLPC